MGAAKRYMELIESRGWSDLETTICSGCVVEKALVSAVRAHGGSDRCDYCEERPVAPEGSAPIELVLELVVDGLKLDYEDPVEGMAWDGGYVGVVHDTRDLLWDLEITEREDVHQALHSAIVTDQWCQRDPYAATPAQALTWGWEAFRRIVKHQRRFTFLTTDHSTADGAGTIPMHAMPSAIAHAVAEAGLVTELPIGSEWWRIRPHPNTESYSSAADLGTPPDAVARDNRMTAKGIGAFYGASTAAGARAEVAGYADPTFDGSIGKFVTTTSLTVVDLRDLPDYPSLFDPDLRHLRAPIEFLYGFVQDATEVADPTDKQNLDYVPTQVVAETFRFDLPVDGVLWRSSKDPSVTSCVLFIPSTEVAELGSATERTRLLLDPSSVGYIYSPL
ncbi:HEPN-associated N-terminal domain-containing protein [Nocardioides sp. NPDC092400]|uniref:HEPN-associated N-terminal domain-containing protein n=1 Tax=Nocardioides sp. NPDC092400 TaxID=3155196 RepID=UPI003434E704